MEKKSLLKKIIDIAKNTFLYKLFFNPNFGESVSSEDLNYENLANISNLSQQEVLAIGRAFGAAEASLSDIVPKEPEAKQESVNPFIVDESELNHDEPVSHQPTEDYERDSRYER